MTINTLILDPVNEGVECYSISVLREEEQEVVWLKGVSDISYFISSQTA